MFKTKKSTKSALLMSAISLLLCVSMLVGSTFAWFTDEVKSNNNIITAGNLDVELFHKDKAVTGDAEKVNDTTVLFDDVELWEPGAVAYEILTVKNVGTLALKYQLAINISDANVVLHEDKAYTLADALKIAVVDANAIDANDRDSAIKALKNANAVSLQSFTESGKLLPKDYKGSEVKDADKESKTYAIVIYWAPSENDNIFNLNNGKKTEDGDTQMKITLGVSLYATQLVAENDSFGPDYDKLAPWTGLVAEVPAADANNVITITTAEELAGVAKAVNEGNSYAGYTIKLGADIDLNDVAWTPIGNSSNKFNGTFIGTGYTISNLYVTGSKGVGLFGYTWTSAHIEGVTINGAYVSGNDYVGAILGNGYLSANCIKDCTVMGAEITATPYLMENGKYDGGAKAGAIAGSAYNGNLTGNKAIDCTITAYRDLGGIAGMLYADGVTGRTLTASGNEVEKVTLIYWDLNGAAYDDNKVNENMGDVVGRLGKTEGSTALPVVENNTATNVTRTTVIKWTDNGVEYTKDVDTGIVTLYNVTDAAPAELIVPEGVTTIGGWSFSGNTTVKSVTMPSTVTRIARKAFDGSAVEKVVLNEGLTEIEKEAFSKATNLKEINFPSTLTTVGYQAFRLAGFETLTLPETLTNIGEGAFRDLSNLTSVIIEGDAVIANFAFRTCALLENVYILGENTTFTGTSQVFTNNDSTNSGVVNVYVPNETVKQRLLDATSNDKSLNITIANAVSDANDLVEALESGKDVVFTSDIKIDPAGMSNAYGATGINIKNGQTVDGNGYTLDIKGAGGTWDSGINTTGGVIKNITVTGSFRGIFINHNSTHSEQVVLENVVIDGTVYTISCDQGMNQTLKATNCTFNGWTSFAATLGSAEFVNCKFGEGSGYAYCRPYADSTFINCVFEEGYSFDSTRCTSTFVNCRVGDTVITAENQEELLGATKIQFPTEVKSAEELSNALTDGGAVVLTEDVVIDGTLNIQEDTNIILNNNELTVSRLEAKGEVNITGGTLISGESDYPALSVSDGGTLIMNDVNIVANNYCNLFDNGKIQAAEYVGLQVFGGTCVLNNCNIEVNVDQVRFLNSAYGIAVHAGKLVMNGGSVKVTSPGSKNPDGLDYQAAFAGWQNGEKTITLNGVTIDAKNYLDAGSGNTTVNTTDAEGSWDGMCVTSGGTYVINYNN